MNENNEDDRKNSMLNKVFCKTDNNQIYKIIRYDKNYLTCDKISTSGLCRSVIINSDNHVVGYSPPKSIHSDTFIKTYSSEDKNIVAQEFVEGTMINVFWDNKIGLTGAWEISTRNKVGAQCRFYNNKNSRTFRELFLEAARLNSLDLDLLNKNFCYSFVLQHPENRIVVPFKYPTLYLIAIYCINNTDKNNIIVSIQDIEEIKKSMHFSTTLVKFPETYEYETYTELIEKYASMNTSYNIVGVVLYNRSNGVRTKIRNPVYEQIRQLRGNQPKNQFQYLCLRSENKVSDFLNFYPEYKKEFSEYRDQLHLFTETLFANYISCYVKKEKPLLDFSSQYRTHMFNIHKKYMDELKEKKLHVTKQIVIQYVNKINPPLLMYCLNFQFRKRNVDFINADSET
jgi:hypothetical protein